MNSVSMNASPSEILRNRDRIDLFPVIIMSKNKFFFPLVFNPLHLFFPQFSLYLQFTCLKARRDCARHGLAFGATFLRLNEI